MKKVLSILLAAVLAFSALAISAAAASEYQTYYMNYDIRNENLEIIPAEGYSRYVLPGEDFKFYVQGKEGYSTAFTIVEIDGEVVEPDIHHIYTISNINSDKTISVYVSMDVGQSNLFSSLIVFVHNILAWFKNIVDTFFKSQQT